MQLKRVSIVPSERLSDEEKSYLLRVLDDFPLKGESNCPTKFEARISNIGNEVLGERIVFLPRNLERRARVSFSSSGLPSNYEAESIFGGNGISPFTVITELSSENQFPVKRRYFIYSSDKDDEDSLLL